MTGILTTNATLGDLISVIYEEYLNIYGDEDIASVAAAATINDILNEAAEPQVARRGAEAA